jgi:hypothetical protein
MSVEQRLKDSVGFLLADIETRKGPARIGVGTCFFINKNDGQGNGRNFLVTAKHVFNDLKALGSAYLRLNKKTFSPGESGVKYFQLSIKSSKWIFHDDKGVDLAVLPWSTLEENLQLAFLDIDRVSNTAEELAKCNYEWPPVEGDEVMFISMLVTYHGRERNFPATRFGHIALRTDETIKGKYGLSDYIVADAQVYKGNSGAPAWACYDWVSPPPPYKATKVVFLLGVLAAAWPEKQEIFQKRKATGKTEIEEYHNLGIALITPIEKVLAIINSPRVRDMIDKDKIDVEPIAIPLSAAKPVRKRRGKGISKKEFENALKRASRKVKSEAQDSSESDQGNA